MNTECNSIDVQYISDGVEEKGVSFDRVKLSSHPRDPVGSGFLSFWDDMVGRVSALTPSREDLHAQLKTSFDLALLKQMVENDAMSVSDLVNMMTSLVSFITKLQSPHRSSEFIDWFSPLALHFHAQANLDDVLIYVPKFFEVTSERLDQIQLEMVNYYLTTLSSYAQVEGPGIFMETIKAKISGFVLKESPNIEQPIPIDDYFPRYLPQTVSYLCSQLQDPLVDLVTFLRDVQAMGEDDSVSGVQELFYLDTASAHRECIETALEARAFSKLLQQNVDLGSEVGGQWLPETFVWDGERLRNLKNEIDGLVLVSTLLISCRSYLLSAKKRLTPDLEVVLQDMLFEVVKDQSVTLSGVVTTAQNFVRRNFCSNDDSLDVLPAGWEGALEEALKKCVSQSSPVFMLMAKRVHIVMVKALLNVTFTGLLSGFSMNSRPQLQQLKVIVSSAKTLFLHNRKCFHHIYSSLLRVHGGK